MSRLNIDILGDPENGPADRLYLDIVKVLNIGIWLQRYYYWDQGPIGWAPVHSQQKRQSLLHGTSYINRGIEKGSELLQVAQQMNGRAYEQYQGLLSFRLVLEPLDHVTFGLSKLFKLNFHKFLPECGVYGLQMSRSINSRGQMLIFLPQLGDPCFLPRSISPRKGRRKWSSGPVPSPHGPMDQC